MMKLAVTLAVVLTAVFAVDQKEIDRINNAQNLWKAGHNEITEMGDSYMKRLCGAKLHEEKNYRTDIILLEDIPKSFDARNKWPHCPNINAIKNQGYCGSCWAVAAASAASDRLCITTNAQVKLNISAEQLFTCCSACLDKGKKGCDGGYSDKAWAYIENTGLVTGGDYGSNEGCQPYQLPPTSNDDESHMYTPKCQKKCLNEEYRIAFYNDKHYAKSSYDIPSNVAAIQSEILKNGPVEAGFNVYDDFSTYTSGVYVRTSDTLVNGHAVKVIGWGVEDGVDYWLVANSWGRNWGENGFFKIRRGTNECDFESYMVAGLMKN